VVNLIVKLAHKANLDFQEEMKRPQTLLPGVIQWGRSQIEIDEVVFLTKLDWVSYFFLKTASPLNPLSQ